MNSSRRPRRVIALAAAAALALTTAAFAQESQPQPKPQIFHATAANTSPDVAAPSLFELEITLDRYTTVAEQETLQAAFEKRGQEGLLTAVQRADRIGRFRVPPGLSYDIRAAFVSMGRDNRRRIILITDRYVGFGEASSRPRSLDYPFTVFQLRVDDSGFGDGELMVAAGIRFDRNGLMIEEFLNQSIRLTKVRQQK